MGLWSQSVSRGHLRCPGEESFQEEREEEVEEEEEVVEVGQEEAPQEV